MLDNEDTKRFRKGFLFQMKKFQQHEHFNCKSKH